MPEGNLLRALQLSYREIYPEISVTYAHRFDTAFNKPKHVARKEMKRASGAFFARNAVTPISFCGSIDLVIKHKRIRNTSRVGISPDKTTFVQIFRNSKK